MAVEDTIGALYRADDVKDDYSRRDAHLCLTASRMTTTPVVSEKVTGVSEKV